MGIAFFIGILMVNAMRADPGDRTAFQSHRRANRQKILHPLWSLIAAVRQQAVIAHADAKTSCDPPQDGGSRQTLPREHEERDNRSDVECGHEETSSPVDWLLKCLVALEDVHH